MGHQIHVSHSDHMQAVQNGHTHPANHLQLQVSEDLQIHPLQVRPLPPQRSAHTVFGQESVWETEAVQMNQTQIHQLYESSQSNQISPDLQGQPNPDITGYIVLQDPQMPQGHSVTDSQMPKVQSVTDPQMNQVQSVTDHDHAKSITHKQQEKPAMPACPKPKLQRQKRVEETSQRPHPPVPHRRSTRRVHERIQAVQELLWEDSSIPVSPNDEVDHLQPRRAASSAPNPAQVDNIKDMYVASTRL